MYIDDIIATSSSDASTDKLVKRLKKDFAIKDLGVLHYFLGIEVTTHKNGLLPTQKKYV